MCETNAQAELFWNLAKYDGAFDLTNSPFPPTKHDKAFFGKGIVNVHGHGACLCLTLIAYNVDKISVRHGVFYFAFSQCFSSPDSLAYCARPPYSSFSH